MSERLFYGEDPEPKRRKFEDFSDEEILQIVDEASVVLESDQDEDDYDRQVRETDRRIREKYHIDADTLNKMRQREFEIVAERGRKRLEEGQGTEFEKTSREMREVFRKKREDRTKQNREMFRALAEYNFDGNLTSEERLLRAIFGQQTEKKDVTPGFAGQLLGVDDIDSDDLYVEVQRQKVEFDYFLAEGPSSLKLDMGSLRRIKDNLSKCHEAVATHWGKRHLYDLTANSISDLTPNFFKDDYQGADKQFRQLEFIIKYASGETRFQAVEFALNCLRADFKNYLQTGAGPKQEFSFNADEWQSEYEETFSQVGYKLLANTIIYGDAEQSAEANKILEQRWPVQKESQSRVEFVDPPYSEFAEAIVEQRGELSGIIKGLQNVIRDSSPSPSNPEEAKRLQEKMALGRTFILKLANFAGGRMARYQFTKLAGQEIAAFVAIEKEAPGAIEKLKDNFNIEFPGRYPREVLMEMLDEHSDKKPYGVLVYPKDDHNTAFHQGRSNISSVYNQLKGLGYTLRIAETDGKIGLLKLLLRFNKRYGKDNKISFMLLGGHGQKDQIHFGDKVGGSVNVEDIRGQGIKRLTEFFVPEATVILESCSTGSDQGIAEAISKFFGTKVIAPKVPTFMEEIQIKKTEKGLDFKVEYFDDDKSVFEKGVRTNG